MGKQTNMIYPCSVLLYFSGLQHIQICRPLKTFKGTISRLLQSHHNISGYGLFFLVTFQGPSKSSSLTSKVHSLAAKKNTVTAKPAITACDSCRSNFWNLCLYWTETKEKRRLSGILGNQNIVIKATSRLKSEGFQHQAPLYFLLPPPTSLTLLWISGAFLSKLPISKKDLP